MANQLLTISMITKESLRILTNSLKFTNACARRWDNEFEIKGAKIGQTINIRKPARYNGRTGPVVDIEAQTETYVPLTLDQQYGDDVSFTSAEQSLSLDMYSDRVLKPMIYNIANRIDAYGLNFAVNQVSNQVGTPGTSITALKTFLDAGVLLDFNLAPRDGTRKMIVDPNTQATAASLGLNLFNPTGVISEQYKKGVLTEALGFGWAMDQQVPAHQCGTYGGTPVVASNGQSGSTLATSGWTSGATTLNAGDVFTIAGVYAVNPQTKAKLNYLQQFVVLQTVSDTAGAITMNISPAIVTSGAFQNVSKAPAAGDGIVVNGGNAATSGKFTQYSLAMHPDSFSFGCAALDNPGGTDMSAVATDPETGLSIRVIRQYNVVTDQWITRTDVLFGFGVLYPQLACKIATI